MKKNNREENDVTANHLVLRDGLSNVVGKQCWRITGGYGTGTIISLHFGAKIEDHRTKRNGEKFVVLEGEYILYVECSWRIDSLNEVIVSCHPYYEESPGDPFNQLLIQGLKRITDSKLESFEIDTPGLDLILSFDNGLSLKIFCDNTHEFEGSGNYWLRCPDRKIFVNERSLLNIIYERAF